MAIVRKGTKFNFSDVERMLIPVRQQGDLKNKWLKYGNYKFNILYYKNQKKCQEGRGILAHICQEVPRGTGNFGTYLPKSEQKDGFF